MPPASGATCSAEALCVLCAPPSFLTCALPNSMCLCLGTPVYYRSSLLLFPPHYLSPPLLPPYPQITHFGFKSVYVLYSDETYGHSIAADLQVRGGGRRGWGGQVDARRAKAGGGRRMPCGERPPLGVGRESPATPRLTRTGAGGGSPREVRSALRVGSVCSDGVMPCWQLAR